MILNFFFPSIYLFIFIFIFIFCIFSQIFWKPNINIGIDFSTHLSYLHFSTHSFIILSSFVPIFPKTFIIYLVVGQITKQVMEVLGKINTEEDKMINRSIEKRTFTFQLLQISLGVWDLVGLVYQFKSLEFTHTSLIHYQKMIITWASWFS